MDTRTPSMIRQDFAALVQRLLDRDGGTAQQFAAAIHCAPSHLTRVLSAEKLFGVATCLALAKVSGVSASNILSTAGYGYVAALCEDLYGPPRSATAAEEFTGAQKRLLRQVLTQPHLLALVQHYLQTATEVPAVPPRAAPAKRRSGSSRR